MVLCDHEGHNNGGARTKRPRPLATIEAYLTTQTFISKLSFVERKPTFKILYHYWNSLANNHINQGKKILTLSIYYCESMNQNTVEITTQGQKFPTVERRELNMLEVYVPP